MKEPLIIIEKEKLLGRCVDLVGRERQYVSVIAVLFLSAYLCSTLIYLCYSTCDYYRGCHCCDLIWMPHLGNILELTLLCLKKNVHFQNFSIKRYGTVPTCSCCYYVSSENLFGKLCIYRCVVKSLK